MKYVKSPNQGNLLTFTGSDINDPTFEADEISESEYDGDASFLPYYTDLGQPWYTDPADEPVDLIEERFAALEARLSALESGR